MRRIATLPCGGLSSGYCQAAPPPLKVSLPSLTDTRDTGPEVRRVSEYLYSTGFESPSTLTVQFEDGRAMLSFSPLPFALYTVKDPPPLVAPPEVGSPAECNGGTVTPLAAPL